EGATVRLVGVSRGAGCRNLFGPPGWRARLDFSPDGRLLACGGSTVSVWDVATGGATDILAAEGGAPCVLFEPDGSLLVHERGRVTRLRPAGRGRFRRACTVAEVSGPPP